MIRKSGKSNKSTAVLPSNATIWRQILKTQTPYKLSLQQFRETVESKEMKDAIGKTIKQRYFIYIFIYIANSSVLYITIVAYCHRLWKRIHTIDWCDIVVEHMFDNTKFTYKYLKSSPRNKKEQINKSQRLNVLINGKDAAIVPIHATPVF